MGKIDGFENLYIESIDCFELLFNQIEDFLFILDENGIILCANNAVLNKLGYTQEEINGISILQIHPQDRREEALEIVRKMIEGSTHRCSIPILNKLGEKIPVETKIFKGVWLGKNVLFCISKDLSEIKMEDALLKAKESAEKANNMKSLFLANMSHDIRTPLNGIVGYLDLMEQDNLTEQQRLFLKNTKTSTELLKHLINDILDFSKIESGKLKIEKECFVMSEIIEEATTVIKPKANEKGLVLHLNLDEDMELPILGDPFRVKQIIINLLSNAKKFTSKGEVRLRAKRVAKNDKFITISIEVEDRDRFEK